MDDRFNTIAGWVLGAGIVALGSSIASNLYFHADKPHHSEKMGYFIEGGEEGGEEGGAGYDLGTVLAAADPAAGEKLFAKCTTCHTINQGGANGIGPNLYGVIGSAIGKHAPGFAYSSALSSLGGNWTYENLDHWLASPKAMAAGTKMSFAGLSKPEDRANVISYLRANGGGPEYPAPVAAESPAEAEAPAATTEGETPDGAAAAGATAAETPAATEQGATANAPGT